MSGRSIVEKEILRRYGVKSMKALHKKMCRLYVKHHKGEFPFTLLEMKFSGLINPTLLYVMDIVQAEEDWDSKLLETVEELKKLEGNPVEEPLFYKHNERTYDKIIQDRFYEHGVDAPGSRHAPLGLGNYDELTMAMYLGNFEDYKEIVEAMSPADLSRALNTRVGYFQVTAIFIPIMGLRLNVLLEKLRKNDKTEAEHFKLMYPTRRMEHLQIFQHLLNMERAKMDTRDKSGRNALFYAVLAPPTPHSVIMATKLLERGVDPNVRDIFGTCVLSMALTDNKLAMGEKLIEFGADPYTKAQNVEYISTTMIEIAVSLRNIAELRILAKAPRKRITRPVGWCSECHDPADKRCAKCQLIWYCSAKCQAKNWILHKAICNIVSK
eukprot:TRINITY_DN13614_c0_g1_i11.p1 TRINITY_DN13614_c0_g1~~TRINITY_DN13614_c0_g1_i11.p1  ORF type:complete len:382 (+),score=88.63 TRINITY_DN13614_c0_g1_i11:54-1199(+)